MSNMYQNEVNHIENSDLYETLTNLNFETMKEQSDEAESEGQNSLQPQKLDNVLATILKDLEFAEVSLLSTSHLLDSSETGSIAESYSEENEDSADKNLTTEDFDSISQKTQIIHKDPPIYDNYEDTTIDAPEGKPTLTEAEENNLENPMHLEESKKPSTDTDNAIKPEINCDNSDQHSTETTSQNKPIPENKNVLKIPLPSNNPYINFVQDFKAKYKGQDVTATTLLALAAARWRKMSKDEKKVYKNYGKHQEEKNLQIEKVRNYINFLKMSEESFFQDY